MNTCTNCGKPFKFNGFKCPRCYRYYRNHPEGVYTPSKKGSVSYATNGDPICHICGEAHRKLGRHINDIHGMSVREYCHEYRLPVRKNSLCNKEFLEQMRIYNRLHSDVVIKKNLIKGGVNTRRKKGEPNDHPRCY